MYVIIVIGLTHNPQPQNTKRPTRARRAYPYPDTIRKHHHTRDPHIHRLFRSWIIFIFRPTSGGRGATVLCVGR